MSRKGRGGRSNKGGARNAPVATGEEPVVPASEPDAEPVEPGAPQDEQPARTAVDAHDSSYPPVDLDTHFFDAPGQLRGPEPLFDVEDGDPRMALKRTPAVAQRRAALQKYVKLAVGAASALCLAALVKVAVTRSAGDDGAPGPKEHVAAISRPAQSALPALPAPAAPPAAVAASSADLAGAATPSAAPSSDTGLPGPSARHAEPDPKAAAKEKNDCRAALERGKVADAIEAGERSVALDATDGEAWLILGAAYQEKGDMKNARRSYRACLEQGKRGPKDECAAMPH
jgi:hypothetical protein